MQRDHKKSTWLKGMMLTAVLAAGIFMNISSVSAATGNWDGAQKAVVNAYKKYKTSVDVSAYNLNYATEYDNLKSMMGEVVSETPYLFYTGTRFSVSRNTSTNQIVKITLGYADAYKKSDGTIRKAKIKKTRTRLDSAVNQARGTSGCAAVHVFDAVGAVLCVSTLLVRSQWIVNVIWRRRGDSVHTRRTCNSGWRNLGG